MIEAPLDVLREIFRSAPFIRALGIELDSVAHGQCHTTLRVRSDHLQQNGLVHGGVVATMADHTAGGAAASVLGAGAYPLTVEFKINLLRGASGERLTCRAKVLKSGRSFIVAESEVMAAGDVEEALVAKAMVTLAVLTSEENARTGAD